MKRMLVLGKYSAPHLTNIGIHRLRNDALQICVAFHELGSKAIGEAKKVVNYENLAVAVGSSTNADSRNWESISDFMGEIHRHSFQDHGKSTGLSHRLSVF